MLDHERKAISERELRGVPFWLVREYLEQLGGQIQTDGWLHGPGWSARLTEMEDYRIGSLRVARLQLELQGDAGSVERATQALDKRLLRAGG